MKKNIKHANITFSEEDYVALVEKAKRTGLKPTTYSKMVIMQSVNN